MPERAGSAERPLWRTDESHALLVELRRLTDEIVALQGGVVPDELADEWRRIVRSLAQ